MLSRSAGRLALPVALFIAACDTTTVAGPVPVSPTPLPPGVWYMHEANGEPLPSMIAERIIGVAQEQTFLDSTRLVITSNGFWEQRYWFRVHVTGVLDRSETVLDEGTWGPPFSSSYTFSSTVRSRTFLISVPSPSQLASSEVMLFYVGATPVEGVYRQTRP